MRMNHPFRLTLLSLALASQLGCGLKGPLYHPPPEQTETPQVKPATTKAILKPKPAGQPATPPQAAEPSANDQNNTHP